ncbi:MAG TPA: hypothetical protein VJZ00_21040 [Thermoanaerobaculia bacterium]|nr:hypothetical protein [Thermoanaerobaculia bacterium]
MIVFERRACAILFNLLRTRGDARPFLLPANVCPIVPVTFLEARQPFELIDISDETLAMDASIVFDRLRTRAYAGILFVRPYGSERNLSPFFAEVKRLQRGLFVIDDKCLCRPDYDGTNLSVHADATLFSTGHAKYNDLGDGGFAHLAEHVEYRSTRAPFREDALSAVTREYERAIATHTRFGDAPPGWLDLREPAYSWDEYRQQMSVSAPEVDDHKAALNAIYAHELPSEIQLAEEFQGWRFNIRVARAKELLASIFGAGLFASRHYASLGAAFASEGFPIAERLHEGIVNLFNDRYFIEKQALAVVELVRRHVDMSD